MNPQEIANKYGATFVPKRTIPGQATADKYGAVFTPTIPVEVNPIADKGIPLINRAGMFAGGLGQSFVNHPIIQGIGQDYANAIPNFLEAAGSSKQNNVTSQAAEGTLRATASGINTVFSPISRTVSYLADELSNNKALQKSLANPETGGLIYPILDAFGKAHNALNELQKTNPEVARDTTDALNIVLAATGEKPVTGAASKTGEVLAQGAKGVSNLTQGAKETLGGLKETAKTAIENKIIQSTANDWERIGGDYVKTHKLLAQEEARSGAPSSVQDTPTFLAEQGIAPKSFIDGFKNKYDIAKIEETATKLTTESVKPFEDALDAQLKVVQQSQPLVTHAEIRNQVLNTIDNVKSITEGDRVLMRNAANKELIALQNKYPKGIPLDILNRLKGTYWSKTKFDITRPLQPQVNYNIGSAMKDLIETKAGDANVTELNGLLGNYYKSAKFLRGLEGKVPKLSIGEKIGRGVVKAGLVAGGEAVFGLSGGLGGYFLAKSVSHILENASNPLKGLILENLQKTNPKAYTEAVKWLGEQEAQRLSRKLLPPPNPLGSEKNPIITPAPTTFEAPAQQSKTTSTNPKTGTQYVRNLKTGKMEIINKKK